MCGRPLGSWCGVFRHTYTDIMENGFFFPLSFVRKPKKPMGLLKIHLTRFREISGDLRQLYVYNKCCFVMITRYSKTPELEGA